MRSSQYTGLAWKKLEHYQSKIKAEESCRKAYQFCQELGTTLLWHCTIGTLLQLSSFIYNCILNLEFLKAQSYNIFSQNANDVRIHCINNCPSFFHATNPEITAMFSYYQWDVFHVTTEDFWHCSGKETGYSQSKWDMCAVGITEMSESFACCNVPGCAFSRICHCHLSYVTLVMFSTPNNRKWS